MREILGKMKLALVIFSILVVYKISHDLLDHLIRAEHQKLEFGYKPR